MQQAPLSRFNSQKAMEGPAAPMHQKQRGSSLLEVLVALLLISLGMLGIAGLAGSTLKYNKASQFRLTGLSLINNYADNARLNLYGYDLGLYDITFNKALPSQPSFTITEPDTAVTPLTAATNVAQADMRLFMQVVAAQLPGGQAVVVRNPSAASRGLDIWLLWQESKTTATDALLVAGQENCPTTLSSSDLELYSCMYFKVGL